MSPSPSQETRTIKTRDQARLSSKLEKNLLAYAAAAGAAGVGLLAGVPTAEAKIVYTVTNTDVNNGITLDLNNDGVVDYTIVHGVSASVGGSLISSYLKACHNPALELGSFICFSSTNLPNAGNLVRETASGAAALPFGAPIQPGQEFGGAGVGVLMGVRDFYEPGSYHPEKWLGPWANGGAGVANRYLGFKFKIGNEFHYGWARLTLSTAGVNGYTHFTATLTGYAYETIPGKSIRAGQTKETDDVVRMNSDMRSTNPIGSSSIVRNMVTPKKAADGASLGLLALGAEGMSIWRREESLDGL